VVASMMEYILDGNTVLSLKCSSTYSVVK